MEIIQLILKLFNLEVKDNDPMMASYDIKEIMHNIQSSGMQPNLPLVSFVKSLYPTYSHYLESLQASDKFKDVTFDTLMEKIANGEKAFGKEDR